MVDDAELLRRFAHNHSQDAFTELVGRRVNLVYSVALRQVGYDAYLAEDVTQKVFTDLAIKAAALSRRAVLTGWLYRSAQFAASDIVRAERRRRHRDQQTYVMQDNSIEVVQAADWEKIRPLLDKFLGRLSETERDLVALRFFETCSFAEIGRRMQLTEDAARKRVERSLEKLRVSLRRDGISTPATVLATALSGQAGWAAPPGLSVTAVSGAILAASTSWTSLILTFMAIKTNLTVGAVALLAIALALYQTNLRSISQSALRSTEDTFARQSTELGRMRERMKHAEEKSAALQAKIDKGNRLEPQVTVASRSTTTADSGSINIKDYPEMREFGLNKQIAVARLQFGRLYRTLGLSKDEVNEFERLYAESFLTKQDLRDEAREHGVLASSPEIKNALQQADAPLRELLGAEGYKSYEDFRATQNLRDSVDTLASTLYFTDSPISSVASDKLLEIIQANGRSARIDPYGNPVTLAVNRSGDPMDTGVHWDKVIQQASTVLNAEQLENLQKIAEKDQANLQYSQYVAKVLTQKRAEISQGAQHVRNPE
jgi:RNA polymerase sigma factor (sigma-70 family)